MPAQFIAHGLDISVKVGVPPLLARPFTYPAIHCYCGYGVIPRAPPVLSSPPNPPYVPTEAYLPAEHAGRNRDLPRSRRVSIGTCLHAEYSRR